MGVAEEASARSDRGRNRSIDIVRALRDNPQMSLALMVLLGLVAMAVIGPWVWPYGPGEVNIEARYSAPTLTHPLGGDELGRDVVARLMDGAQISLLAVAISVSVSFAVGFVPGLMAGYIGGRTDRVITRIVDGVITMPALILAISIVALLGPGLFNAMLAVGLVLAPRLLRVVRSAVLSVREEAFVEAAITMGGTTPWVVRKHIVRNVLGPTLVILSTIAAYSMIAEASLSFLGLGVQPPQSSLGSMVRGGMTQLQAAPWLMYAPSLMIVIAVVALNYLSDALSKQSRDARDETD